MTRFVKDEVWLIVVNLTRNYIEMSKITIPFIRTQKFVKEKWYLRPKINMESTNNNWTTKKCAQLTSINLWLEVFLNKTSARQKEKKVQYVISLCQLYGKCIVLLSGCLAEKKIFFRFNSNEERRREYYIMMVSYESFIFYFDVIWAL